MTEQLRKAMDDLGAEPLRGSGFEDEISDPDFSESEPGAPEHLLHALRSLGHDDPAVYDSINAIFEARGIDRKRDMQDEEMFI
jgi:hypothetical protein